MTHRCQKCGDEFDSKRGLSIHQSQMHDEEEKEDDAEEMDTEVQKTEDSKSGAGITLSVKQFGGLTFAIGLLLGVIVGGAFGGGFQFAVPDTQNVGNVGDTGNTGNSDNTGDAGSGVVELQNSEYPFGSLESGSGEGSFESGGATFNVDGEPYIGTPSAEVTAISYEDFECPFCSQYNKNAFPQIVENHVKNGEVQYFYKNLPLNNLHPWAEPSAIASECALNQDAEAFWTFKQGFFSNQEALGNAYNSGNFDASMYRWAEQTGLNVEEFKQCYDNEEELEEVNQDKQEAGDNGAQATPTIFINGEKVEGAQPYSRFQSVIESQLGQ